MSNIDPLLQFISRNASDPDESSPTYNISVVVGGVLFKGPVFSPNPFLQSVLPTGQLVDRYRQQVDDTTDADTYLHMHVEEGPGITTRGQQEVRFRMDCIDAWWAN